jgi:hypothetical protein
MFIIVDKRDDTLIAECPGYENTPAGLVAVMPIRTMLANEFRVNQLHFEIVWEDDDDEA